MTADIVLHSTFPAAELARELEVIRQEAIEYAEDPQESGSDCWTARCGASNRWGCR
jgi:predicted Zn-dependent peptidase